MTTENSQMTAIELQCVEVGCMGSLSTKAEHELTIEDDGEALETVTFCPECGRMHHKDGSPCFDCDYNKVFWISGDLEAKPLDSNEKKKIIVATIEKAKPELSADEINVLVIEFEKITRYHSRDCPGRTNGMCRCGNTEAIDFIRNRSSRLRYWIRQ